MKNDQKILTSSVDILSHVFSSDAESTPHVHKAKTRPARRGRAGRRLVEKPPPDDVTTPKKTTRKDPPLILFCNKYMTTL